MNRLMVNINAIIVNMQKYVLESVRKGLKDGVLSEDVFTPLITNHSVSDYLGASKAANQEVIYSRDDILAPESGSETWRETTDLCMVLYDDCYIELYTFYLFKLMERGDNAFATEMLQDYNSFAPYLPLF